MKAMPPLERKTRTAFAGVNFSSVVPKMRMMPIVLINPNTSEVAHTINRRAFIPANSSFGDLLPGIEFYRGRSGSVKSTVRVAG
jgi:hypothetical protein